MVVAYVRLYASLSPTASPSSRVYALLLPSHTTNAWAELDVRPSRLGGYGLFPARRGSSINWDDVGGVPVLLPYLGVESVTKDAHSLKTLLEVLKGHFERVTVGEVEAKNGGQYVADGLFAVARTKGGKGGDVLTPSTKLLQVALAPSASGVGSSVCYLLADDVRVALHLNGENAHLFDLLCAHQQHEHAERHLATHCATIHRKEEGYVLINAHPGFADPVGITGIVNEPAGGGSATTKMVQGYAKLLSDDEPLMRQLKLTQPAGARLAWEEHILPPVSAADEKGVAGCSERMVMYMTTRKAYPREAEFTVDYGKSYSRDYASSAHRASCPRLYPIPPEPTMAPPDWPRLPGWYNAKRQPPRRPAFSVGADGTVSVCPDEAAVVAARVAALGARPRATSDGAVDTPSVADAKVKAPWPPAVRVPPSSPSPEPRPPRSPRTIMSDVYAATAASTKQGLVAGKAAGTKRGRPVSPITRLGGAGGLSGMFAARKKR